MKKKIFICERCEDIAEGWSHHKLCQQCFIEIVHRYTQNGEPLSVESMNYIEEASQLGEFFGSDLDSKKLFKYNSLYTKGDYKDDLRTREDISE